MATESLLAEMGEDPQIIGLQLPFSQPKQSHFYQGLLGNDVLFTK